jgi:hypothetical protein
LGVPFGSITVRSQGLEPRTRGLRVGDCEDERIEQRNLNVLRSKQIRHVLVMGLRADFEEVQTYEDAGLRFIALVVTTTFDESGGRTALDALVR